MLITEISYSYSKIVNILNGVKLQQEGRLYYRRNKNIVLDGLGF